MCSGCGCRLSSTCYCRRLCSSLVAVQASLASRCTFSTPICAKCTMSPVRARAQLLALLQLRGRHLSYPLHQLSIARLGCFTTRCWCSSSPYSSTSCISLALSNHYRSTVLPYVPYPSPSSRSTGAHYTCCVHMCSFSATTAPQPLDAITEVNESGIDTEIIESVSMVSDTHSVGEYAQMARDDDATSICSLVSSEPQVFVCGKCTCRVRAQSAKGVGDAQQPIHVPSYLLAKRICGKVSNHALVRTTQAPRR
jgi:hypothetical protein